MYLVLNECNYSLEKNKNYWRLGKKQIDNLKALKPNTRELSIKDLISENKLNPEIVNELKRNEEMDENIYRTKMFCKGYKKIWFYKW